MNVLNFDDIWGLMSNYKFSVDPDPINNDLICLICHGLMIDAHQSTCGCQFCHKCICEYLGDNIKCCPGAKIECREENLIMGITVTRNVRMNKRISNLEVFCPTELCQMKLELTKMNEHLRVCKNQSMECPFLRIGCDYRKDAKHSILTHLKNETFIHSQLLIEYIEDLRNNLESSKLDMSTLREESRKTDNEFREIFKQIAAERREIIEQTKELRIEMEYMKEDSVIKEKRIATLEKRLMEVSNKNESELSTMTKETEDQRGQICTVRNEGRTENIGMELSDLVNWINSCPNSDADFAWRIDDWTKKKETMRKDSIFSEPFYSNDYKLSLRLYIGNVGDIWLDCYLMRGDNDDKVPWPMKLVVMLSVIDQDTLKAHHTIALKYDTYKQKQVFKKPDSYINSLGIGTDKLLGNLCIKDKASIIVNDSIVVSCITSDL